MLLYNEKHEQLNIDDVKAELENVHESTPILSTEEIENELGSYYNQALQLEGNKYQFRTEFVNNNLSSAVSFFPPIGKDILDAIKKFVCGKVDGSSTSSEIIEVILDAISSIIPGGILLKPLIKKLVKYILSVGVSSFCKLDQQHLK